VEASDLERLRVAGIYDPTADDAAAQREVLDQLVARGLTLEDILTARRLGTLVLEAFGHLLRAGGRLDLDEVATMSGLPAKLVLRFSRAAGFPDPGPGERRWTAADVEMLTFMRTVADLTGLDVTLHATRTLGTAVSRIAEAEIGLMRSRLEAPLMSSGATWASILSRYFRVIEEFLPASQRAIDGLHRRHLEHLVRRYSGWALPPSALNVLDMTVGFADLVGSTALVQQLDLAGLERAITTFEDRTSDVIAAADATLVKRLGDAVMFVTPFAEVACRVALDLVDAFAHDPVAPPVRVGLAAGHVVALRGDFYGAPVHLAARIVAAAPAATVRVSADVCERVGKRDGLTFGTAGAHTLAGFETPVELYELRRGP
jgi:class 3 adenylate cyclase